MTPDAWIAVGVTLGCLILLAATDAAPDMVLMAGLAVLLAAGVVGPAAAFSGFSNSGVLTVAALYVVAAGIKDTGAMSYLIKTLFGRPNRVSSAQLRMMLPVTFMSAFMNNTPIVATFIPAVGDWAKQQRISASKLMMPLSYAAILGGTCTLIGTSTNLVVNGLLRTQAHLPGLGFFEIAWIGLPYAIIGLAYIIVMSRWLLPERVPVMEQLKNPREYTVEMIVENDSVLTGVTIQDAGLRHLPGLYLIEIDRDGQIIAPAGPDERLQAGDRLVFAGITESIVDLQKIRGLVPATNQLFKLASPRTWRTLIEAVVSNTSPIVGKTIRAGRFRSRYDAVVIAVAREGHRIQRKIGDIEIRPGDTLLLETTRQFLTRHRHSRDFLLLRPIEGAILPRRERSWAAWLVLLGFVVSAGLGLMKVVILALLAAGAMVLLRCCSVASARRSIEIEVILVIAAAFGIGRALEISGAAQVLAGHLLAAAGDNPWLLFAVIYLATMLMASLITHIAAAVIMFPLALATASSLQLNFLPFAIAIMMAASASFATPIGYQTNIMVYGPGGYRFTDYLRFGLPLNLLLAAAAVLLIPQIWPLTG
jgi:di/tricarboxylate transporter